MLATSPSHQALLMSLVTAAVMMSNVPRKMSSSPSTETSARATITRRLCTIAGFYRYAVEEDLVDHSPAAHVRRPRLDYESHAVGLDRSELGALLVAAGLGSPAEHALISLLA